MEGFSLQAQMLGGFVLRWDGGEIPVSGRSRKLCLLLAVLICHRDRPVSCRELIDLLWQGEARGANPLNSLKAILHRARAYLAPAEQAAGQGLILYREGCFQWNRSAPLTLDTEELVRLCRESERARGEERRLELGQKALSLYRGDFLPMLSGLPWAAEQARRLHQLYLQTVYEILPLLERRGRWQEAAPLAASALALEPCCEDLCIWQMKSLLQLDRHEEAVRVYEEFQDRLLARLGVMPSDALRALCQNARQDRDPRALTPDTLLERLEEPPLPGALFCGFDFFRVLCHAAARRAGRGNEPVHVALITLSGPENGPLPRYSLDRAMDHLQEIIMGRLRRGDAVTRCGASQFILLLPQAGLTDSQTVCRRITRAFTRQFPHSPAALSVSVQPLSLQR